jgi:hypothetical protein
MLFGWITRIVKDFLSTLVRQAKNVFVTIVSCFTRRRKDFRNRVLIRIWDGRRKKRILKYPIDCRFRKKSTVKAADVTAQTVRSYIVTSAAGLEY